MPHVDVKLALGGQEILSQFNLTVEWLRLEMSVDRHHTAAIRLASNAKSKLQESRVSSLDDAFGKLADTATVELVPPSGSTLKFDAIVTGATHERALDGNHTLLLNLASPTILLDAGPRCRIWEDSTAKDIANAVAGNIDALQASLDKLPSTKIPYEAQFEETDFEFLRRLAGRHSIWLYYDGQKLCAESSLPESGEQVTLTLARDRNVGRLEDLSVTSRIMPGTFLENQFLGKEKKDVVATQAEGDGTPTANPFVDLARDGSLKLYKPPIHPHPLGEILSENDVNDHARARSQAWFRSLVVARANTSHPGIRPGVKLTVEGAEGDEDADYLVTESVHEYARPGGYRCRLSMVPVPAAYPPVMPPRPVTGLNRAVVVGDYGAEHPGMVRVRYSRAVEESGSRGKPGDSRAETTWARVSTLHGGETAGFVALPEIGDEVIVGHLGGRATHPIILGSVYSQDGGKKSPVFDEISDQISENEGKALLTKSGNLILLTDTKGSETIELRSPEGKNLLRMTLDGPRVELQTEGDVIVRAQKTVTLESDGDMILDSKGKLTLKSQDDLEVITQANLRAEAMRDLDLSANQGLSAKGMQKVHLEGAQLKAQGTATAEVAGAQASVKGQAMVQIQAPLVKIN